MSSTKKFGLNQLAQQGSSAHKAFKSMRYFCQEQSAANIASAAIQKQQQQQQMLRQANHLRGPRNSGGGDGGWPHGVFSHQHRSCHVGRVSKVLGVKRTLVNQMQGMMQKMRPKLKSPQSACKYNIYGQTKLFSSMSSMQDRSSSSCIFTPVSQNRCLSSSTQPPMPLNAVVQQRYNQFGEMHEIRNGELAKDISRSIQAELMEVDSTTKKLISCAHGKLGHSSYDQSVEEQQQQQQQQQQLQMQPHHQPLRYDPLEGWKHPRPMKLVEAVTKEDCLKKQHKPLRRKLTNIRYKDESMDTFDHQQQQFTKLNLKSGNFRAKLNELYNSSAKLLSKKQRSDLREPHFSSTSASRHIEPQKNLDPVRMDERYTQTSSERDYLERNIFKSERENAPEGSAATAQVSGRMDELHYQSKMDNNLMSASQRVINKQFEGNRSYQISGRNMLANNPVQVANVTPVAKVSSKPPPTQKARLLPKPSPVKYKNMPRQDAMPQSKNVVPKIMRKKTTFKMRHSTSSSSSRAAAAKKLENTMSSKLSNPSWRNSGYQYRPQAQERQNLSQMSQSPNTSQMQEAEMSESRKPADDDLSMPTEYTKESAVQRLGNVFEKRFNRSYYAQNAVVRQ